MFYILFPFVYTLVTCSIWNILLGGISEADYMASLFGTALASLMLYSGVSFLGTLALVLLWSSVYRLIYGSTTT